MVQIQNDQQEKIRHYYAIKKVDHDAICVIKIFKHDYTYVNFPLQQDMFLTHTTALFVLKWKHTSIMLIVAVCVFS